MKTQERNIPPQTIAMHLTGQPVRQDFRGFLSKCGNEKQRAQMNTSPTELDFTNHLRGHTFQKLKGDWPFVTISSLLALV